jgi:hypothetical protein
MGGGCVSEAGRIDEMDCCGSGTVTAKDLSSVMAGAGAVEELMVSLKIVVWRLMIVFRTGTGSGLET